MALVGIGADTGQTLLKLADEALVAGKPADARSRYSRLLELGPAPDVRARAEVGLGRIARDEGDVAAAREHFGRALEADPDSVPALVGLASVEPERERELLERAVAVDYWSPEAHARLQARTGRARRDPGADPVARGDAHPYDPWAAWQAGVALAGQGRGAEAAVWFDSVVWLGDLDPLAAHRAFAAQASLPEARWSRRVPVHVFADETIRRHPGWEFRLRHALQRVSLSLKPLLDTAFAPVSIRGFQGGPRDELAALEAAWAASGPRVSPTGIVALFTERPLPRRRGRWRLGQAEFLGRRMTVRLRPEPGGTHTLAHELLHLYGGMHLSSRAESLMNPSGTSLVLDRYNTAIVRSLRERRFGPGGRQANVFAAIDLGATTHAYLAALERNAVLRQLNLEEGRVREVLQLDPHLGDVCTFVAELLWRQEERVQALTLLEASAVLYGPQTPRGRAARRQANELRAALKQAYGVD